MGVRIDGSRTGAYHCGNRRRSFWSLVTSAQGASVNVAVLVALLGCTHQRIDLDTVAWDAYTARVLNYDVSFALPPSGDAVIPSDITSAREVDPNRLVVRVRYDDEGSRHFEVRIGLYKDPPEVSKVRDIEGLVNASYVAKYGLPQGRPPQGLQFGRLTFDGRQWAVFATTAWGRSEYVHFVTPFQAGFHLTVQGLFGWGWVRDERWYASRRALLEGIVRTLHVTEQSGFDEDSVEAYFPLAH